MLVQVGLNWISGAAGAKRAKASLSTSGAAADDNGFTSGGKDLRPGVHNLVKDGGNFMASLGSFIVKSGAEVGPQVRSMSLKRVVGETREADSVSTV